MAWDRVPVTAEDWSQVGETPETWTDVPETPETWSRIPTVIPVNLSIPVITGTAEVGETLTASTGSWLNNPSSYAYAWYRDGVVISGATASAYTLQTADSNVSITVRVTAINRVGPSLAAVSLAVNVAALPIDLQAAVLAFSPAIMFDIADTTSLFQALTGGAAADISNQIGFVLDKSQFGDQTAAEFIADQPESLTNGTFDADVTGWTNAVPAAGTMTWVDGKLRMDCTATNRCYQSFATVVGEWYQLSGSITTVVNTTNSFWAIRKSDNSAASSNVLSMGGNTGVLAPLFFRATATTTFIVLQVNSLNGGPDTFDFDDISVKHVPGKHAAAPSTGQRPDVHFGPYFDFAGTDILNVQVGSSLGSNCTIYYRTEANEDVVLTGQTINAGTLALPQVDFGRYLVFPGGLTGGQLGIVKAWGDAYTTPPLPDDTLVIDLTFTGGVPTALEVVGEDAMADLIDNGDGTWSLTRFPFFYDDAAATVLIEYELDPDYVNNPPSGIAFHWTNVALNGFQYFVNTAAGTTSHALYAKYNFGQYYTQRYDHPRAGISTPPCRGRRRVVTTFKEGQLPWAVADNFIGREETVMGVVPVMGSPLKLTWGRDGIFGTSPLTNGEEFRFKLWKGLRTRPEIEAKAIAAPVAASPVNFVGDSFLNGARVLEQVLQRSSPSGYVAYSNDGEGGTTLFQQRDRMIAYAGTEFEKWYASTLVVVDGFLEIGGANAILALNAMAALLSHNRWVYVQSTPAFNLPGSAARITYDADMAAIEAGIGAHYLPTLAPIINTDPMAGEVYYDVGGPSEADDLADIANQLWPRSLQVAPGDFHPSEVPNSAGWSGAAALGDIIYKGLVARGYLPA